MIRTNRFLAPSLLALALVVAACGGGGDASAEAAAPSVAASVAAEPSAAASAASSTVPSEAAAEEVRVTLEDFNFDTEELTITAGTEVTFLNADPAPHTVTEGVDGEAAGDAIIDDEHAANQSTSFTFDEPGTYELTCRLHPNMNMTVVVEG
jgi:plastocyanin